MGSKEYSTILCSQCGHPRFHILYLDGEYNTICAKCGILEKLESEAESEKTKHVR